MASSKVSFDGGKTSHERQPLISGAEEVYDVTTTPRRRQIRRSKTLSALSSLQSSRRANYKVSSLDFERVINHYSVQAIRHRFTLPDFTQRRGVKSRPSLEFALKKQRRRLLGYSGRTATRWVLTIVAGLTTGLTAIFLVSCTGAIVQWRARIMHDVVANWGNWGESISKGMVFQRFLWTNLILALLSCILCVGWVPAAAGE